MRFEIGHLTRYVYEAPVFLEPHTLRLTPRSDASQRLEAFQLLVEPSPSGRAANVDIEGNETINLWFEESTASLEVRTAATVETLRANPFEYLWAGGATLPMTYAANLEEALRPHLQFRPSTEVTALSSSLQREASGDSQLFLLRLTRALRERVHQVTREEGPPLPSAQTLSAGEGSCRDTAMVFIEVCRAAGLAARFVSGYHAVSETPDEHDLHAWAEVYLPGGGWRAFDPSVGLAVADGHIALASAGVPELAAPVSGTYRGSARLASFETKVELTRAG